MSLCFFTNEKEECILHFQVHMNNILNVFRSTSFSCAYSVVFFSLSPTLILHPQSDTSVP